MVSTDLSLQLVAGHRLMLAEIIYHMPDYPGILQSFIWQHLDLAPQFPVLHRFLHFWTHNLDGKLHEVRVACREELAPAKFELIEHEFKFH